MPLQRFFFTALWPLCATLPLAAQAACPDDAAVKAYLTDFGKRQLSAGFGAELSAADAECAKAKVTARLPLYLGSRIGYKAAFTSAAAQKQFGVDGPRWGTMFDRNMVDIIAVLPANFGARPLLEADMIVEVKDPALADAKTPLEALACIESMVPFIELPDLMLQDPVNGNALVAINAAFRGGVTGAELPLTANQATVDALANMTVVLTDLKTGQELGRTAGKSLMGHPLNAAIWLAQALKKDGITLKKGDVLSLGSFMPALPVQSGMQVRLQYLGLTGDPSVTVEFN